MRKLHVFHGTDFDCATAICQDGFGVKSNTEHWLGNGIYFYMDESLAKWWTTNPSNKFGSGIKSPALVECDIIVPEENVLDLTRLEDYKKYAASFNHYFQDIVYKRRPRENLNINKLRCSFFDWIFLLGEISVIIGAFNAAGKSYLPISEDPYFSLFRLTYPEVQVCLYKEMQDMIKNKTIKRL
jgi:hypothetical protein